MSHKLIFLTLLLSVSCGQSGLNVSSKNSEDKKKEVYVDPCYEIVSNIIGNVKKDFDLRESFVINLKDTNEKEKKCLEQSDDRDVVASVETYLKYAEAVGLTQSNDDERIAIASVETYLKYAEAVGSTGDGSAVAASTETYLKYAEASELNENQEMLTLFSVETYLKAEESGIPLLLKFLVASEETYLKYAEAVGGGDSSFTSNTVYIYPLSDGHKLYDPYAFSGLWSQALTDKKVVYQGELLGSKKDSLLEILGVTKGVNLETTSSILDRGIIAGFEDKDISLLKQLNPDNSAEFLLKLLDKGVIANKKILEKFSYFMYSENYLNKFNSNYQTKASSSLSNDAQVIDRIFDKGIVVDYWQRNNGADVNNPDFQVPMSIWDAFTPKEFNADTIDRLLDKGVIVDGFMGQYISYGLMQHQAFSENEVENIDRLLDHGFVAWRVEDNIFVMSVEEYLKIAEAVN